MNTLRTTTVGPSMVLKNCCSNLRSLMPEYEPVPPPPCLLSYSNMWNWLVPSLLGERSTFSVGGWFGRFATWTCGSTESGCASVGESRSCIGARTVGL